MVNIVFHKPPAGKSPCSGCLPSTSASLPSPTCARNGPHNVYCTCPNLSFASLQTTYQKRPRHNAYFPTFSPMPPSKPPFRNGSHGMHFPAASSPVSNSASTALLCHWRLYAQMWRQLLAVFRGWINHGSENPAPARVRERFLMWRQLNDSCSIFSYEKFKCVFIET